MQLWTEYEGCTVDGAFILEKLLLPEGRSAFFSTSNANGVPSLIRLIASHFDEEEILARWRGVEAIGHPNILKIERYGQLVLDDTTVVYANFEPVDATLADVIVGQRLTVPEAKQLAFSLASALDVLHKNGFVHEHIEPAKVFAVGEVVKLRGDCIRETPEGEIGQYAKKKDIHDLSVLILLALTQSATLEQATKSGPLPFPFNEIVPNGLNGTWELDQIVAALDASQPASFVSAAPLVSRTLEKKEQVGAISPEPATGQDTREPATVRGNFVPPGQRRTPAVERQGDRPMPSVKWAVPLGLVIVMVFGLIWHVKHLPNAAKKVSAQRSSTVAPPPVSSGSAQTGAARADAGRGTAGKPSAAGTFPQMKGPLPSPGNAGVGAAGHWRVVAFTYNRTDQARQKADSIAQKHPALRPAVFTPTGRAPYLVTLGGVMNRDQAFALAQQARKFGLPHDTYAQNYGGR